MKQRYIKAYHSTLQEWQQTRQKADSEQIQANAKKGLESGLKSKLDRLLFYQKEIELMEKQLRGEVEFTFKVGNKVNVSHNTAKDGTKIFVLPIDEQNKIRLVIKDYQIEISKIEGDYINEKSKDENSTTIIINGIPIAQK